MRLNLFHGRTEYSLWFSFRKSDQKISFPAQILSAGHILAKKNEIYLINSKWMCNRNPFGYCSIQYSISGEGFVNYFEPGGIQHHQIMPGQFFLMAHDWHFEFGRADNSEWEWFFVTFDGELSRQIFHEIGSRQKVFSAGPDSSVARCIQSLLAQAIWRSLGEFELRRRCCELLIDIQEQESMLQMDNQDQILGDVDQYIQENVSTAEVPKLAARYGYSVKYFQEFFRRKTGITPGSLIRTRRVSHAKMLLESTTMPLAEIADLTGFTDASHFCRIYRKYYGCTPNQWRNSNHLL